MYTQVIPCSSQCPLVQNALSIHYLRLHTTCLHELPFLFKFDFVVSEKSVQIIFSVILNFFLVLFFD